MTPEPPRNAIVSVSLAAIGVSLGYVTVAGFWRDEEPTLGRWRSTTPARMILWTVRTAPGTVWQESD